MNLKNKKIFQRGVLVILYLLHVQAFLTDKIREELRLELGLMNIFLVPLCIIINLYFVGVIFFMLQKNKSMEKIDMYYIILSLLLYGLMGYNLAN